MIVDEFFVGPGMDRHGLEALIQQQLAQLKTADSFAALSASTALRVAILVAAGRIGKAIEARWHGGEEPV